MSENLSPSNNYRSILMFFSDENVIDFCEKYQIGITNNVNNNPYHICNYDGFITHFVQSLMQIKNYDDNLQQQLLQPKFEEIMLYLVHKKGVEFIADLVENQNDYIRHFKEVIENNKLNHLSIQELAFLSNMSLSTFKRTFEKNYKTSPSKWFQDKRLAYAAFLLTNKKERPIDVYENIGYESLSSFTQAFKEKFGTTPKQFQLQNWTFSDTFWANSIHTRWFLHSTFALNILTILKSSYNAKIKIIPLLLATIGKQFICSKNIYRYEQRFRWAIHKNWRVQRIWLHR